ncbi:MAG TPA: carboxymuconolactone decarboxylase family protein [Burkholderiaceae bacterium]
MPMPADTTASAAPFEVVSSRRLPLRQLPYEPAVEQAIRNSAFKGLSPLNLRLVLAQDPGLSVAFQGMAHVVLFKGSISERDREIAIIRTGALTRSEYEWGMHVSIYAEKCGLTEAHIDELTLGGRSAHLWTDKELAIIRMVDELHHHSTVGDATWAALQAHWPPAEIVQLILASSFYHMAAFFLNSTAVPLETGSRRFPPGLAPASVPEEFAP